MTMRKGSHHHGVFLLRNTAGQIFREESRGFEVQPVLHLDTKNLAMASRIDIGRFRQGAGTYFEQTHKSENEVSAYFSDWIGVQETLSSKSMISR
mmetsp:Transcript_18177/g.34498  ORF Transcript_18177/g.34498 Transcript_18177/m.34498 type:complete len:95 (+) Transcript_18177:369-653(+)